MTILPLPFQKPKHPMRLRIHMGILIHRPEDDGADAVECEKWIELKSSVSISDVMKQLKAMYLDALELARKHQRGQVQLPEPKEPANES